MAWISLIKVEFMARSHNSGLKHVNTENLHTLDISGLCILKSSI